MRSFSFILIASFGGKEEEVTIKDGKRQGKRTVWYLNGVGWLEENYINDTLHGVNRSFYKTGQLETERSYEMGKPFGIARSYIDSSATRPTLTGRILQDTVRAYSSVPELLRWETVYGLNGDIIVRREYDRPLVLRKETVYAADSFSTTVFYHSNGRVRGIYYEKAYRPYRMAREFDEHGKLTKTWMYDSSGKQLFFKQEPE
jgi:antitoxin component YwqK of YwqJK toxin-antitoxin module